MGQGVCLKSISGIQFGMFTGAEMQRMAHLVVCSKELYRMPPNRESVPYGVLDPRLGISSSADTCGTCGRGLIECPGHWGVIVLELPVFHIGFLKATIAVLQNVCKVCSRVLLKPDERKGFLRAMRDPRTDSLRRTRLVKRITDIAKKCPQCPWCGALNGAVKKVNAIQCFRLLHDRYKLTKGAPKEDARKAFLEQVDRAARSWVPAGTSALGGFDPNLVSNAKQRAFEELSPVRVMELFKAIPDSDLDLLWMDRALGRPETMLTTHILVPPVAIRPSVPMEAGGGSNEDDITMQLQKIVHSNAALKLALSKGGSGKMIQENWDWLQVCTAAMVNGEVPGFPPNLKPKRPIRGLAQRLKGKQGRFRGNLSGKRVDFSGRTVIGPDPNLPLFAVGVPLHVAKIMTFPERVTAVNLAAMRRAVLNGAAKYPGANNVRSLGGKVVALKPMAEDTAAMVRTSQGLRIGDVVERHMIDGDVVLFNRQPSLHKMSIMAHRARVLPGRTFRFNECVCTPYNADFDGDEMNLHLPQTEESRAEAAVLMDVRDNMINSRSGEPLIAAHQDFITAAWLLTQRDTLLTRDAMCQVCAYLGDGGEEVVLPQPAILTPGPFWTGKQVIGLLLRPRPSVTITASFETKAKNFSIDKDSPPDLAKTPPMCPTDGYVVMRKGELLCGNLDKSIIGGGSKTGLIHVLIRENSGRTAATALLRLTKMTSRWLADWGFSMGIEDVTPSPFMRGKKSSMVAAKYEECEELIKKFNRGELTQKELQPGCDEEQSLEVLVGKELGDLRKELGEMCSRELPYANPPRIMAICGSKGQNLNISQMIACVGQQQVGGSRVQDGFVNRTLPIFNHGAKDPSAKGFVANSFFTGLSATEFFMHTMGGRESLVDTAVKTAETGYMQRRMMKSLEDCNVHYDGTVRTSSTDIVQFAYGDDGMDPVAMEAVAQQSSSTASGVKPGYLELSRCLAHSKVTAVGGGGGGQGGLPDF
jgi:DNA-directed RNA polymerase III subunit RPC1